MYTKNSNTFGNGALKYAIGLITLDEMILSGGYNVANKNYYLYSGNNIWTMTLNYFNGDISRIRSTYANGNLNNNTTVANIYGVKPVINLKQGSLTAGDGTIKNPYLVD